jgi:hypothetical protein
MAHYTVLAGNAPVAVAIGDAGATFTNLGTGPLYYGYDEDITETSAGIGTISAGSSAALYGNVYLYVPRSGSRVDVEVAALSVVGSTGTGAGIDVCAYGTAPGFSSVDQSAKIQQAIDAANANYLAGNGPTRVYFSRPGTYPVALRNHPTTTVWAASIWMREGVDLDLSGVTLKLVTNATMPDAVVQQGYIISNVYTPPGNSGTQTGRFTIRNGVLDGNGNNQLTNLTPPGDQFNGALFAALHLNRTKNVLVDGVVAKNVWGTSPAPPVGGTAGAIPGGESFCFMTYRCDGTSFRNCVASGEEITDSATGWNDTYGANTTIDNCTAHHFKYGMGFSSYQVSHTKYVGCWAHSCVQRNGFNLERCDHVTYSACIAGGRLTPMDDPTLVPYGYTTNEMTLGNNQGWSITGGYMVTLDSACQSAYNTTAGVSIDKNSVNWDRVSNRVTVLGTHLHTLGGVADRWDVNVNVNGPNTITSSTFTGTTVSGSKTMTAVAAGTGTIVAGQEITGTGIPFGTTIDKYVSGTSTITMSAAATASGSGVAIVGISDVYVYAKATVSNGIGNQIGMTEAAGNLVKEFGNYGTAAGARFQAGTSAAGTFAFRFFGLRAGGPGLALTSANQAQTQGRIRARTAVTGNYSVALTDDILAVTNSDTTSDTITLPTGSSAGVGATYTIIDEKGGASGHAIVLQGNGAETITNSAGAANTKSLITNFGAWMVYWNGSTWVLTQLQ